MLSAKPFALSLLVPLALSPTPPAVTFSADPEVTFSADLVPGSCKKLSGCYAPSARGEFKYKIGGLQPSATNIRNGQGFMGLVVQKVDQAYDLCDCTFHELPSGQYQLAVENCDVYMHAHYEMILVRERDGSVDVHQVNGYRCANYCDLRVNAVFIPHTEGALINALTHWMSVKLRDAKKDGDGDGQPDGGAGNGDVPVEPNPSFPPELTGGITTGTGFWVIEEPPGFANNFGAAGIPSTGGNHGLNLSWYCLPGFPFNRTELECF